MANSKGETLSWKTWSPQFKEFAAYIGFLSLFALIVFGPRNSDPYFMQKGLESMFVQPEFAHGVSFETLTTTDQFYTWMEEILLPNMYPTEDSNGQPLDERDQKLVGGVNKRLGAVRLRSIRVRPDSCEISEKLKDKFGRCYGVPSSDNEDTSDWVGVAPHNHTISYSNALQIPSWFSPLTKISYTGNGHVVDFNHTFSVVEETVESLKAGDFIDFSTRAVFITANFYNANVDLVGVVRFNVEFIASGAIQTSTAINCSPLIRPVRVINQDGASGFSSAIYFLEWIFYVWVLVYIFLEVKKYRSMRSTYFRNIWNVLDFVNLLFFFVVIILKILSAAYVASEYDSIMDADREYLKLEWVSYFLKQVDNTNAFNAVLTFFKLFKFMRENKKMSQVRLHFYYYYYHHLCVVYFFFSQELTNSSFSHSFPHISTHLPIHSPTFSPTQPFHPPACGYSRSRRR